jgi:hypothetical protein
VAQKCRVGRVVRAVTPAPPPRPTARLLARYALE